MMRKTILISVMMTALFLVVFHPTDAATWRWAKGNLHTHTTNSDGDSSPEVVADWYRSHGYQFVVITDHRTVTKLEYSKPGFIVIHGQELAAKGENMPVHADALGIERSIPSPSRSKVADATAGRLLETIRAAGGLPMLNHPYVYWLTGYGGFLKTKSPWLIEVFNGSYDPKQWGDAVFQTAEQMWDSMLSQGRVVYCTAADDAHRFKKVHNAPEYPGRGWVVARVKELTPHAVMDALRRGDFYASTGVELADYGLTGKVFHIRITPQAGRKYTILLIGIGGKVLRQTSGTSASFTIPKQPQAHAYVRCKVVSDTGKTAWTQAYRLKP